MTDRELLELAAKAAGYEWHVETSGHEFQVLVRGGLWNPLSDDGDALRLAVKLEIRIDWGAFDVVALEFNTDAVAREAKGADPYAATRRAITRAAAELGKGMK